MFDWVMLAGGGLGACLMGAGALVAMGCKATPAPTVYVDNVAAIAVAVKACPQGGCRIRLAPGNYGDLAFRGLAPASMVDIDLTGSTFTLGYFPADSNLRITGGEVVKGNQWGQCWIVDGSVNIVIQHAAADRCAQAGFIMTRSRDVAFLDWTVTSPICDGVDVAGMDGFLVSGGSYSGLTVGTGCHADGIQMWGMDGYPLQHGQIINNVISSPPTLAADGKSMGAQGITAFANNAPGGGAYPQDDITATDNTVYVHGAWCIVISKTTNVVAKNNQCMNVQPKPWNGRYGWSGSTGEIGPNWMDNVQQTEPSNRGDGPTPPRYQGGVDLHLGPLPKP